LHQMAHVVVTPSTGLKLLGRGVIFEVFPPVNVTDRQTIYDSITALCVASRGKNREKYYHNPGPAPDPAGRVYPDL